MDDPSSSDAQRYAALKGAVTAHLQYMGGAMQGQGCDRHLLGMRMLALERGIYADVPLFNDPALAKSSNFTLSTSNISGSGFDAGVGNEWWGGFAPWMGVTDGVGACYTISPNRIKVMITAWNASEKTDCDVFRTAFGDAMRDLGRLAAEQLAAANAASSKL
jgi:hypothetical protein